MPNCGPTWVYKFEPGPVKPRSTKDNTSKPPLGPRGSSIAPLRRAEAATLKRAGNETLKGPKPSPPPPSLSRSDSSLSRSDQLSMAENKALEIFHEIQALVADKLQVVTSLIPRSISRVLVIILIETVWFRLWWRF